MDARASIPSSFYLPLRLHVWEDRTLERLLKEAQNMDTSHKQQVETCGATNWYWKANGVHRPGITKKHIVEKWNDTLKRENKCVDSEVFYSASIASHLDSIEWGKKNTSYRKRFETHSIDTFWKKHHQVALSVIIILISVTIIFSPNTIHMQDHHECKRSQRTEEVRFWTWRAEMSPLPFPWVNLILVQSYSFHLPSNWDIRSKRTDSDDWLRSHLFDGSIEISI